MIYPKSIENYKIWGRLITLVQTEYACRTIDGPGQNVVEPNIINSFGLGTAKREWNINKNN